LGFVEVDGVVLDAAVVGGEEFEGFLGDDGGFAIGPTKRSMASKEDHRVSTMKCTTTPSDCVMTRASRKPSKERRCVRTCSRKWRR